MGRSIQFWLPFCLGNSTWVISASSQRVVVFSESRANVRNDLHRNTTRVVVMISSSCTSIKFVSTPARIMSAALCVVPGACLSPNGMWVKRENPLCETIPFQQHIALSTIHFAV